MCGAQATASPTPAPIWPIFKRELSRLATNTSSTGRRCGRVKHIMPGGAGAWSGLVPWNEKKHHGLSLIIVDMKSPGVTVRPLLNFYGRHHFNEVFFDNVEVPAANLVGMENKGWYHLMQALVYERRSFAPSMYGVCKKAVEALVEYVKNTKHEGEPLSQYVGVRNQLASIAVDLEALRLFAFQITWLVSQGGMPIYEASRNKLMADMLTRTHWTRRGGDTGSLFAGRPVCLITGQAERQDSGLVSRLSRQSYRGRHFRGREERHRPIQAGIAQVILGS